MGRESKAIRVRTCPVCEHEMFVDAQGLREHAIICKRATAAGLVLPGVVGPKVRITKLED